MHTRLGAKSVSHVVRSGRRVTFLVCLFSLLAASTLPSAALDCGAYSLTPYVTAGLGFDDPKEVAFDSGYAYLIDKTFGLELGLRVINVSDPLNPVVLDAETLSGTLTDVAVSGDYAYVTNSSQGKLFVVDISDPMALVEVTSISTSDDAMAVAISGNYAFVSVAFEGVDVIDISNPLAPVVVTTIDHGYGGPAIAVDGDRLYVSDQTNPTENVAIIDISNPLVPVILGTMFTDFQVNDIVVEGDLAYLTLLSVGLMIFDVTDPSSTVLIGDLDLPGAVHLEIIDGFAYILQDASLDVVRVVDLSDLTSPVAVSAVKLGGGGYPGIGQSGGRIFVSGHFGLHVIDVSGHHLVEAVSTTVLDDARQMDISGDVAYVACDFGGGLYIIDISDPSSLSLLGIGGDVTSRYKDVAVLGDYAYVTDDFDNLVVMDVSDPGSPSEVANLPLTDAWRIVVSGQHAYVTGGSGIHVVDISNPLVPVLVTTLGDFRCDNLAVLGDYLYAPDEKFLEDTFYVLDISNPAAPVTVGALVIPEPSVINAVTVVGNTVYLTREGGWDYDPGLVAINVSDPSAPAILGSTLFSGSNEAVAIQGGFAYLAAGAEGMQVWDVSDPASMSVVGHAPVAEDFVGDVRIANGYVLLATQYFLAAYPLTCNPASTPELPAHVGGLRLEGSYPSPFAQTTTIRYRLSSPADVNLQIFDLSGRAVRTLLISGREAGLHQFVWDGRDDRGRAVASGIYPYRLGTGQVFQTGRAVVSR